MPRADRARGGLALALASDIRIAAASATFNAAFVRIGLSGCDIGVSCMLPRLIGAGRSHELLLTARLGDSRGYLGGRWPDAGPWADGP